MLDPTSLPLLGVLAFSLALFPVGLLLPGCACCGVCPDAIEFQRCVRITNISPNTSTPIHGFSRTVTQPSDINATRVCRTLNPDGSCAEYGWNIRFRVPSSSTSLTQANNILSVETLTDFDTVAAFLRGEQPITVTMNLFNYGNRQWEISISQATPFCGKPLCSASQYVLNTGAIPLSATVVYGALPQTAEVVGAGQTYLTPQGLRLTGPVTAQNGCYTGDSAGSFTMRLSGSSCSYSHTHYTCETLSNGLNQKLSQTSGGIFLLSAEALIGQPGSQESLTTTSALGSFFCGDLLWAIENGPCNSSVTTTEGGLLRTVTINGTDSDPWITGRCYPVGAPPGSAAAVFVNHPAAAYNVGKCAPLEVDFTVSETLLNFGCRIEGGTVVASLFRYYCHAISYVVFVPFQTFVPTPGLPSRNLCGPGGSYFLQATYIRSRWCDQFVGAQYVNAFGDAFLTAGYSPGDVIVGQSTSAVETGTGTVVGTVANFSPATGVSGSVPSASPETASVAASGGTVAISRCCPSTPQTVVVPATTERYGRVLMVEAAAEIGSNNTRGKTVYITQQGYGDECKFTVQWLGITFPSQTLNWQQGVEGVSARCFYGQVNVLEGPACEWTVTSSQPWVQVRKVSSGSAVGLIEVLVDDYPRFTTIRTAAITVSMTSGTTLTYTITQGT